MSSAKQIMKLLSIIFLATTALADITVTTCKGKIRGLQKVSLRNTTYYAFLQIPYAQPPLGKLRFRNPRPAKPWSDVLNATQEKKICHQMSSNSELESEDCLYINVYTPARLGNQKGRIAALPVIFYIHGGGFINGNSLFSTMGPQLFMDNNVVIVTVLYRLGPFGFLSTGDNIVSGNYGLKDQNMALTWVNQNIRSFGGDPDKIIIVGQSSGAVSVGYHIISRASHGLFKGAILQSGSVLTPHGYQRRARYYAYALAKYIDPNFNGNATSQELLSLLQNATAKEIDSGSEKIAQETDNRILNDGSWFAPVIEPQHHEAFITGRMYGAFETGRLNRVPIMIGFTSEEAIGQASNLSLFKAVMEQYDANPSNFVAADMHINNQRNKTLAGEAIRKIYTDGLVQNNLAAGVKCFSDSYVTRPVLKHAELQSAYSDVYLYQFSYQGALGGDNFNVEGLSGVSHGADLRYLWVFNNYPNISDIDAKDLQTAKRYMKLYLNFAKTLNPIPEKDSLLENVTWPKVDEGSLHYLNIDEELTIKSSPKEPTYSKWVELYNKWAIPPYDTY